MDTFVEKLTQNIIDYCCDGDESVRVHAGVFAFFCLKIKKEPYKRCFLAIQKPGAKAIFKKLLSCRTGTLDGESRMIGIDFSSRNISTSIQENLDVKHCCKKNENKKNTVLTFPHSPVKADILYFDEHYVRIRFFSENFQKTFLNEFESTCTVIKVNEKLDTRIWELYIEKNIAPKKIKQMTFDIINILDKLNCVIIYCTELKIFDYDILLFISNFIKFYYCSLYNKLCFDPKTFEELQETTFLFIKCFSFLDIYNLRLDPNVSNCAIKNLSSLTPATHGPLAVVQGERPKVNLKKIITTCGPEYIHVIEGTRSLLSTLNRVDCGSESNYLEIITKININECKKNII
ncbi:unknown [Gryllus bimaculatus nudivirus]|uniref:Uncharacterized protein n=1 Tax=Gryllus bimaculatus nudivirus TaxID=432587 RepID=A4L232_9VIRU|nr:hypothetical protein GrBNV_gp69 [Gryllus bimaculatus nudivirus]ABO45402.1 unknown [Gryllus bimaculatus nudivirus]